MEHEESSFVLGVSEDRESSSQISIQPAGLVTPWSNRSLSYKAALWKVDHIIIKYIVPGEIVLASLFKDNA